MRLIDADQLVYALCLYDEEQDDYQRGWNAAIIAIAKTAQTVDAERNRLCDMFVLDKENGNIHRIGEGMHDAIWVVEDALHYRNLQNGDGGTVNDAGEYGYVILRSDCGCLEDDFGIIDKRYEKEIKEYLNGRVYSQHRK